MEAETQPTKAAVVANPPPGDPLGIGASVNNALLSPFLIGANVGLAAVNMAAEGASRAANMAARALRGTSLPLADAVSKIISTTSDTVMEQARKGVEAATGRVRKATAGAYQGTANQQIAETLLDDATSTIGLPLTAASAAAGAVYDCPSVQHAVERTIVALSSTLDPFTTRSIFPDSMVRERNARFREAAVKALFGGPFAAVARDFDGMVGGVAAFLLGDPSRLARGAPNFKSSMEYVFEKKLHGEVQPESDFPLKAELAVDATDVVARFPETFIQALERGNYWEIAAAYMSHMGDVNALLTNYPAATYNVLTGVSKFVFGGIFVQIEDGYAYPLNELAIFDSRLSNEEKDWAHGELRKTAPKSIVGFEYYIPLLVDMDGDLKDKSYRRNAAGEVINDRVGSPSIFPMRSIQLAQSIHSELSCLPSLIWLYGDEKVARAKNSQETIRKFGPKAAQRIADHPLFPMSSAEIAELTRSGPKTQQQIEETLDYIMRVRGLIAIADGIKRGSLAPLAAG
jgi:hypothetical protein